MSFLQNSANFELGEILSEKPKAKARNISPLQIARRDVEHEAVTFPHASCLEIFLRAA